MHSCQQSLFHTTNIVYAVMYRQSQAQLIELNEVGVGFLLFLKIDCSHIPQLA